MIGYALNTAQSISNFGMLAVTAGFFLVLSAILIVTCFKWFMRVINNTMDNQKKSYGGVGDGNEVAERKVG